MAKQIQLEQLSTEIEKIISNYTEEVIQSGNEVVEKYGTKTLEMVKQKTNLGYGNEYGHVRDSWKLKIENNILKASVTVYAGGKKGFIASFLENGTSKMSPRPMATPTFHAIAPLFTAELRRVLSKK